MEIIDLQDISVGTTFRLQTGSSASSTEPLGSLTNEEVVLK